MKKLITLLSVLLLGVATWSCQYDDNDLWNEIGNIKAELTKLNTQVGALQTLVDAVKEQKTITQVTETADGYTITFNDGKTITITNGKNAPEVGIDLFEGDYYWTLGGKDQWLTDQDGNKIPVSGKDGVSPSLAVDADGYWTLGGVRITDAAGVEVKAAGADGDSFFESVADGNDEVTFTLTDGTKIVLPKASATTFAFERSADEQSAFSFGFGEERTLTINTKDVTSVDLVTTPKDWGVVLNRAAKSVTVTAPAASGNAYTEGIVTLVAIDKKGKTVFASACVCAADYDNPKGTFVLNEGNMTSESGSLIYINPTGQVTEQAYRLTNGSELGNTAQDMFIGGGKMYIISQNGGNDGKLVVANAKTLKRVAGYNSELSKLSWPTHVAAIAKTAYIRDNAGIYGFDLETKTLTFVEGSKGALKNRMAVIGDKLFVPASKSVLVIQNGTVVQTIPVAGTVTGVIKSYDDNLWVACSTSPAQISKISASDYSVIQTNTLPAEAKVGAGFGATPGISAKTDTLYFSNSSTKIYRHIFSKNQTDYMTDVKTHVTSAGMVYNNLAVHPRTGEVYFTTIKGYGMDYLINDISVFDFSSGSTVLKNDYQNYTRFPAGTFFTDNF